MRRTSFSLALAIAALVGLSAIAPAQFRGRGHGHHHQRWGRTGFGFGFGFVNRSYAPRTPVYRNAFTSDVAYAERAMNEFRAVYEQRSNDRFGVKADVQRLDQTLEQLRRQAEAYGSANIRSADLLREALADVEVIDRGVRSADNALRNRWDATKRIVERLERSYRGV